MPAIGFIGSNPSEIAQLYQDFVAYVTEFGVQRDQDHTPAIVLGITADNKQDFSDNLRLIKELGATKIIVTSDDLTLLTPEQRAEMRRKVQTGTKIISIPPYSSLKQPDTLLITSVTEEEEEEEEEKIETPTKIRKINTGNNHKAPKKSPISSYTLWKQAQFQEIFEEFKQTKNDLDTKYGGFKPPSRTKSDSRRSKKLDTIAKHLKKKQIIGVLGGAGVMTGADCCKLLAKQGTSFLMLSDTTAPDKNNATDPNKKSVETDSFVPSYERDIRILAKFTTRIAIPCNTAHILLPDFCKNYLKNKDGEYGKLVHIGHSTIKYIREKAQKDRETITKVILLGTPATVNHENSAYQDSILNPEGTNDEDRIELIAPTEEQLKQIYFAIYESKGYRTEDIILAHRRGEDISKLPVPQGVKYKDLLKKAHERVLTVINDMKNEYGNFPVILGCTELPLLFSKNELIFNKLISSTEALAIECQEVLQKEKHSPQLAPLKATDSTRPTITLSNLSESDTIESSSNEEKVLFDITKTEEELTYLLSESDCDIDLSQKWQEEEERKKEEKFKDTFNKLSKQYEISYHENNKIRIFFTKRDNIEDDKSQFKRRKQAPHEKILEDRKEFYQKTKTICEYFNLSDEIYTIHHTKKYLSISGQENVEKIKEWLKNENIEETTIPTIPIKRQFSR